MPRAAFTSESKPLPTSVSPSTTVTGRKKTRLVLSGLTLLFALVQMSPLVWETAFRNSVSWPLWAQSVLGCALLQVAYAAWLLTVPDWSAVRVLMVVHAAVAMLYGMALMIVLVTPHDQVAIFDLEGVRSIAHWWCPFILSVAGVLSYLCGHISHRWRYPR